MASKFLLLTRSNMRNLKANEKINEGGIVFERLENSDGRFTINIMVDGQRIHRVVGKESEGVTRKQAEDLITKLRSDARQERLNLPKGRKLVFAFKEAAEKYLEKQKLENARNLKSKIYQLKLHLIPFFGDSPLNKISNFDVERYKKFRLDKAKQATINRELAVLSHLFTKAIEWNWIDARPATIRRYKEDHGRITYLTVEQIERLLAAAKHDQHPQIYPFIMIGLETAMRKSEILSIRLEHIDLERKIIFIPKAKAGARQQPITTSLAEFLKNHITHMQEQGEWLFHSEKSTTGHTINIDKPFRRVVETAELDPKQVVRHTLRHTAITHLVQAGVDLPTVKRISGHKTLQMVERYSHQNGSHIQAAMDKLESRYRGI